MELEAPVIEAPVETIEVAAERPFLSSRCAALGCAAILCADCPLVRLQTMIDEADIQIKPDRVAEPVSDLLDLNDYLPVADPEGPAVVDGRDLIDSQKKITTPLPVEVKNTTPTYLERLMDDSIAAVVADSLIEPERSSKPEITDSSLDDSRPDIEFEQVAGDVMRSEVVILIDDRVVDEQTASNVAKSDIIPEIISIDYDNSATEIALPTATQDIFYDVNIEIEPIVVSSATEVREQEITSPPIVDASDTRATTTVVNPPRSNSKHDDPPMETVVYSVRHDMDLDSPALTVDDEYIATSSIARQPMLAASEEIMAGDELPTEIVETLMIHELVVDDSQDDSGGQLVDYLIPNTDSEHVIKRARVVDDVIAKQSLAVDMEALLDGRDELDPERGGTDSTSGVCVGVTARLVRQLAVYALIAKVCLYGSDSYLPLKV